jgi:hypothetical protein
MGEDLAEIAKGFQLVPLDIRNIAALAAHFSKEFPEGSEVAIREIVSSEGGAHPEIFRDGSYDAGRVHLLELLYSTTTVDKRHFGLGGHFYLTGLEGANEEQIIERMGMNQKKIVARNLGASLNVSIVPDGKDVKESVNYNWSAGVPAEIIHGRIHAGKLPVAASFGYDQNKGLYIQDRVEGAMFRHFLIRKPGTKTG